MTPSAFSTGDWQDQQKKQQPAAAPATSPQSAPAPGVAAPPQAPATPPQPAINAGVTAGTSTSFTGTNLAAGSTPANQAVIGSPQRSSDRPPPTGGAYIGAAATPPQSPQTWGQHNNQQARQRNYYGQQPQPGQPQQMPAQTAASYGMPTAAPPQASLTGINSPNAGVDAMNQFNSQMSHAGIGAQPLAPSGPGGSSFMESAQVDPLPPEEPGDVLKAQPTSGMAPRPRPQRSYYGG